MKRLSLVLAIPMALAGCALKPNLSDKTPPNITLTVYYQAASHASNSDEIRTPADDKCIFVASEFLVSVIATDPEGVARISIASPLNNSLRVLTAVTKATPPPASPVQGDSIVGTYPNPGSPFGQNAGNIRLTYFDLETKTGGPVHTVAQLEGAFEFVPGRAPFGSLLVEAWNSNAFEFQTHLAYHVRLAGTEASEQPGKPCKLP
jgi:hypothetical protein